MVVDASISSGSSPNQALIDVEVSGGTEPYEFIWSGLGADGVFTEDLEIETTGTYGLLVEDDNGCSVESEFVIVAEMFGCTDSTAINFDSMAIVDDGTCVYFLPNCDFIGNEAWSSIQPGFYSDTLLWHHLGIQDDGAFVLHMPEVVIEPASGSSFAVIEWSDLTLSNLPLGMQAENMPSEMTGGEQVCVSYSGLPVAVGVYAVVVSGDLTVSLFGNPYVVGSYDVVGTVEIVPNPNPIPGCTYSNASNYLEYANADDGSCTFLGCTEEDADNYQPLAVFDDGSCEFGVCEPLCPADINGDGIVNTNDLLGLLGYFGLPCEE